MGYCDVSLILTAPRASIADSFNIRVIVFNYRFTKLFLWILVRVKMRFLTRDEQGQNKCMMIINEL